jgi:phage gpG-like protein
MQISIEVQGLDRLKNQLQIIADRGHNTAPLMAELANHLYNVTDKGFNT